MRICGLSGDITQRGIDVAFAFVHISRMSRFESTFRNAIANAEKDVLVDQIRANPQMSLSELGKLATGELGNLLKQITVADLVGAGGASQRGAAHIGGAAIGGKPSGAGRGGRKGGEAASVRDSGARDTGGRKSGTAAAANSGDARKPKAAQAEVDTRTGEGRAAYDEAVLAALRAAGGPQSASGLTAVAGGSPLQIRTALARLIENGTVNWSGRARGTRYTPA